MGGFILVYIDLEFCHFVWIQQYWLRMHMDHITNLNSWWTLPSSWFANQSSCHSTAMDLPRISQVSLGGLCGSCWQTHWCWIMPSQQDLEKLPLSHANMAKLGEGNLHELCMPRCSLQKPFKIPLKSPLQVVLPQHNSTVKLIAVIAM